MTLVKNFKTVTATALVALTLSAGTASALPPLLALGPSIVTWVTTHSSGAFIGNGVGGFVAGTLSRNKLIAFARSNKALIGTAVAMPTLAVGGNAAAKSINTVTAEATGPYDCHCWGALDDY
jgi:hypothetical protein